MPSVDFNQNKTHDSKYHFNLEDDHVQFWKTNNSFSNKQKNGDFMKTSGYAKEIYGEYDAVVERAPRLYHISRFGCLNLKCYFIKALKPNSNKRQT